MVQWQSVIECAAIQYVGDDGFAPKCRVLQKGNQGKPLLCRAAPFKTLLQKHGIAAAIIATALMASCLGFVERAYAENVDDLKLEQFDLRSLSPDFTRYKNARFGYSLTHPSSFVAEEPPHNGAGQSWLSKDGVFELNSFASFNSDEATPESLKQELTSDDPRFKKARQTTVGKDRVWLLSDEGPRAYGYAALFSCDNQILNVVELSFPSGGPERSRHNKFAELIVSSFEADRSPECAGGGATTAATGAAQSGNLFFDPAIKRLLIHGWSSAGLQNGLWTAGVHGHQGSVITVRCTVGPGELRNGSIELRHLKEMLQISGQHQVNVEIGDYQHGGVFTYTPGDESTNGLLDIVEDSETAGVYLEFIRALASGDTLMVELPDNGYREQFDLSGADRALGPCMGKSVVQPWTSEGMRDGVYGASVRNEHGAALYIRCDSTAATRGNALFAFAAPQKVPTPGLPVGQQKTVKAFVDTRVIDLLFSVVPHPEVITGAIFHLSSNGDDKLTGKFLSLLSSGDEDEDDDYQSLLSGTDGLRLINRDLEIDTRFVLSGAREALAACNDLYR